MKDLLRITVRDDETTQIKFDMNGVEEAKILVGSILSLMEEDKNVHLLLSAAPKHTNRGKRNQLRIINPHHNRGLHYAGSDSYSL